jgi:molecular chaperone GrpE (heat shock protein)
MEIKLADEFASTMQQLSAEAEKALPEDAGEEDQRDEQFAQILRHFSVLNGRMLCLEERVAKRFEKGAATEQADLAEQMRKMDDHMVALRNTESVNQRLFDSLHEELIKYRDNFLHESLQKPFIRDLLILFDDLTALSSQLQTAEEGGGEGKRPKLGHWRDNLENAIHSLTEILHRMEVSEIESKEMVDRAFHRVVSYEPSDFAEDEGRIVMRVKRGFLWRDQVLRPEEVVAKRFE